MKRSQLRQALTLTPNIHYMSSLARTPLLEFIAGFIEYRRFSSFDLTFPLEMWLEDLLACDINLGECGRIEHACWIGFCDKFHIASNKWDRNSNCWRETPGFVMASFRYGPLPSDWEIKLEEVEETYKTPGDVPGGWVEEDQGQIEDRDQTLSQGDFNAEDDSEIEEDDESEDRDQN